MSAINKPIHKSAFILDLLPGKLIDLQFNMPVLVRLKFTLVGYDIGNYIVLKLPTTVNASEYRDVLTSGNIAIVRYIVEGDKGECVAFSTTIKSIIQVPEKLIFLEYPTQVENRQLRNKQRLKTHIPAQISQRKTDVTTATISGAIVDISLEGCQFVFKPTSSEKQVKKVKIIMAINSANNGQPIVINAIVRNSRYQRGKIFVGVQFEPKDKQLIQNLLNALALDLL
jgi:c-di-GMP-binding flagellar brake protein YcgR